MGLCRVLHDAVCCPLGASRACATLTSARGMQAAGALDARSVEEVAEAESALVDLIQRAERIERGRAAKKQASPLPLGGGATQSACSVTFTFNYSNFMLTRVGPQRLRLVVIPSGPSALSARGVPHDPSVLAASRQCLTVVCAALRTRARALDHELGPLKQAHRKHVAESPSEKVGLLRLACVRTPRRSRRRPLLPIRTWCGSSRESCCRTTSSSRQAR